MISKIKSGPEEENLHVFPDEKAGWFAMLAVQASQLTDYETLRHLLESTTHTLHQHYPNCGFSIAEIGTQLDGRPLILNRTTGHEFQHDDYHDFYNWFKKAVQPSYKSIFVVCGTGHGMLAPAGTGTYLAIFVHAENRMAIQLSDELLPLSRLLANTMSRVKMQMERDHTQKQIAKLYEQARVTLETAIDLEWESTERGVLHCSRLFTLRDDLAQAISGMRLHNIQVLSADMSLSDYLKLYGRAVRLPVKLGTGEESEQYLVSTLPREESLEVTDDVFQGVLTALPDQRNIEAGTMLAHIRGSRLREEQLRIESETIIEGLRLLFDVTTSSERLSHLVDLLCRALHAQKGQIIVLNYAGQAQRLSPSNQTLDIYAAETLKLISDDLGEKFFQVYAHTDLHGERAAAAYGLDGNFIAATPISFRTGTAFFLCSTGSHDGFSAAGLAFLERFNLLIQQALYLRDEQMNIAQTSKMAILGKMSTSIAHELKQPLNTISLAAQNLEIILSKPAPDTGLVQSKIDRVLDQVNRATEIIDRMRHFGNRASGHQETVKLKHVVEEAAAIMRPVLERHVVSFSIEVDAELAVHIDPLQIEQVLTNIIQNAVDAMTGIGMTETSQIRVLTARAEMSIEDTANIVLNLEDTGPGFPASVLQHALEPFFTTKTPDKGTGLGLAICDQILREGGGYMELGNHDGGGRVTLHLPHALD